MYGMVNSAIRGLVIDNHGEAAWVTVHTQADAPATFEPMQPYADEITYRLVGSAVATLGGDVETLLREFGRYWIRRIAVVQYADLLQATGTRFTSFVRNLDHMHARLKMTFPSYTPPSFRVIEAGSNRLQVDYYSEREGLQPFVEGLLEALAEHFGERVQITRIADHSHNMPCKRMLLTLDAATA